MPQPDLGGPIFLAAFLPFDALDPLTQGGNVGQADWTDIPSVAVAVTVITIPVGRLKPTVTIWGQTPWSRSPIIVVDRVVQRAKTIKATPPPPAARATYRALRQRSDTDSVQKPVARRINTNPPRRLAKAPITEIVALRQRLDTDAKQKPVAQRINLEPSRPLASRPTVQARALRQRSDTDQFERRTNSRDVNPPQPLPKLATATYRALRQRSDTDQFQKPVARRITTIAAGRVPGRPTVVTTRPTWLYFVPAAGPRWVNRILIVNVPRPLPPKTSGITGGGILEGSADRATNRVLVRRVPAPTKPPAVLYRALRQRSDTDAVQKPVADRITLLPAQRLPQPARATYRALRQRSDTDAVQKPVARRINTNPARRLAGRPTVELARPVWQYAPVAAAPDRVVNRTLVVNVARPLAAKPIVKFARPVWLYAPAPAARVTNRVYVVTIPRPLPPKPGGITAGGLLEGSAPPPERFKQRVCLSRVRPPTATRPSNYRHYVYAEPQADGGLCLSFTLVQLPVKVPTAPTVRMARPVWRNGVVVDRARIKPTVLTVPLRPHRPAARAHQFVTIPRYPAIALPPSTGHNWVMHRRRSLRGTARPLRSRQ